MRVTILDYGAGNLHSLAKAVAESASDVRVETDAARALEGDVLVLPGVGAFGHAAQRLASSRGTLRDAIREGFPCLGICLGMQLLFDESEEGEGEGLGVIPGRVTRLRARRVPHIGWTTIDEASDRSFTRAPLDVAYYANGFACRPERADVVRAWSIHEDDRFPAMVRDGSALGVQFHPEKSSRAGVAFLGELIAEIGR
ncbi:MAG: imidazole glycerol phosphate synthase subunit HisH [Gemmatimonadota bacterium]|nr:imidazole glycerol phosphate synthase subunit HisH [Gemmatimonadota bacterium]